MQNTLRRVSDRAAERAVGAAARPPTGRGAP